MSTLITNTSDFLEAQFARIASLIEGGRLLEETILRFHLEGPFLSKAPGYPGAHPSRLVIDPDPMLMGRWQSASGGRIRMITLAPEVPGAAEFIRAAVSKGVFISLGHTDSPFCDIQEAADAGARMVTHLGNGCPIELHRHDNYIQRFLAVPELLASVIPDGLHVPPPALARPHTEALYATLLAYEITGESWCIEWHDRVRRYTNEKFPDTQHGEWKQKLDRKGNLITDTLFLPVKDPFHLPRALYYCVEVLTRLTGEKAS